MVQIGTVFLGAALVILLLEMNNVSGAACALKDYPFIFLLATDEDSTPRCFSLNIGVGWSSGGNNNVNCGSRRRRKKTKKVSIWEKCNCEKCCEICKGCPGCCWGGIKPESRGLLGSLLGGGGGGGGPTKYCPDCPGCETCGGCMSTQLGRIIVSLVKCMISTAFSARSGSIQIHPPKDNNPFQTIFWEESSKPQTMQRSDVISSKPLVVVKTKNEVVLEKNLKLGPAEQSQIKLIGNLEVVGLNKSSTGVTNFVCSKVTLIDTQQCLTLWPDLSNERSLLCGTRDVGDPCIGDENRMLINKEMLFGVEMKCEAPKAAAPNEMAKAPISAFMNAGAHKRELEQAALYEAEDDQPTEPTTATATATTTTTTTKKDNGKAPDGGGGGNDGGNKGNNGGGNKVNPSPDKRDVENKTDTTDSGSDLQWRCGGVLVTMLPLLPLFVTVCFGSHFWLW